MNSVDIVFRRAFALAGGFCLMAVAAAAPPDPALRIESIQRHSALLQQTVAAGRQNSAFCANCHGQEGNSAIPEVPNLAGQNALYILEQMRKFAGGERKDPFMQGLIKILGAEERLSIALFYSSIQPAAGSGDGGDVRRGREVYRKQCSGCHGEAAHGSDRFPRLAGQHPAYLKQSLTRYRDRTGERRSQEMNDVAAALGDADIAALASYLATLR